MTHRTIYIFGSGDGARDPFIFGGLGDFDVDGVLVGDTVGSELGSIGVTDALGVILGVSLGVADGLHI